LILAYNIEEIAIDEMRIIMDNNGDEKDDIDEYLPEANQYITMVALLYNKGQRVTDLKGGNFIVNFHIENTSNFTGYCNNGNFGTPTIPDERDTGPDYKLENANPDGISPVSFSNDGKAVAVLRCDDYGGHTTLKALVKLTDRLELNAEKEIPKDENDNEIADNWEYETHQGLVPNTDDDSKPQGANFGDGLTNFEEYRGFITVSGFIRTNPKKKDIFVYNQDGLSFGEAVQLDLVFHEVSDYDYTKPHTLIINRNGSNTQHIVFLHRITEEPKEPTETGGVSNNWLPEAFNVPLSRPEIKIYSTVIQGVSNGSGARCGIPFDVPYGDIYNVVIAHEFGHIVDIEHNDAPKSGCRGYPDIMKSPLNVCSMPKCFANTTISKNMRLRP
jgi:hypothetical protein